MYVYTKFDESRSSGSRVIVVPDKQTTDLKCTNWTSGDLELSSMTFILNMVLRGVNMYVYTKSD